MKSIYLAILLALWPFGVYPATAPVLVLSISGPIGPATADYVQRGIERAAAEGAQLVLLTIDTPGGLDVSMRSIIRDMLASSIPVASFVSPRGARAASAGTYIVIASQVAAMAPATDLGAATPVQIGFGNISGNDSNNSKEPDNSALARKEINDAAAYIRGLAQMRQRNADWAEHAVRQAVSLSAEEALKSGVIDLIADDTSQLLQKLDGRKVIAAGAQHTLFTSGAAIVSYDAGWRTNLLAAITNPSLAYILGLIGVCAVIFELSTPGLMLPGVIGGICVLISLYAFHLLPVNYAGLALMALGIGFMIGEGFLPAYGSLGIGGVVAFAVGSMILIDSDVPGYSIPIPLIAGLALAGGAFVVFAVSMAVKARRRPVVTGREAMLGSTGEVLEAFSAEGWANIHGETWRVRAKEPMLAHQRVRVLSMDGLILEVAPESHQGE